VAFRTLADVKNADTFKRDVLRPSDSSSIAKIVANKKDRLGQVLYFLEVPSCPGVWEEPRVVARVVWLKAAGPPTQDEAEKNLEYLSFANFYENPQLMGDNRYFVDLDHFNATGVAVALSDDAAAAGERGEGGRGRQQHAGTGKGGGKQGVFFIEVHPRRAWVA
jgi:hypothetical protein